MLEILYLSKGNDFLWKKKKRKKNLRKVYHRKKLIIFQTMGKVEEKLQL